MARTHIREGISSAACHNPHVSSVHDFTCLCRSRALPHLPVDLEELLYVPRMDAHHRKHGTLGTLLQ